MTGRRQRRSGSRLLLAVALLAGTLASMYAGARLADFLMDLLGVASTAVRLGAKVLAVAAALPAGYYCVERFFLERSVRGGGHSSPSSPVKTKNEECPPKREI
jgi:hypothetical protein